MKINKTDKINEYFEEIKTETIFTALKEKKYKGVKRGEIGHLLKSYDLNQVFSYLKVRYKKKNYLIIYLISLVSSLLILGGISLYRYIYNHEIILFKYLDFNYLNKLAIIDYFVLFLISILVINLILIFYELFLKLRNLKYKLKN